jgi:uncharacterized radical SAM superfamily Fe-S cluster-containing enzyme
MRLRVVPSTETLTGSLIEETKSFCPHCLSLIDAKIIERDGKVYMIKECCGKTFEYLKEKDVKFYKKVKKYSIKSCIGASWPINQLHKNLDYLSTIAIHITARCNTNCAVCVADDGTKDKFWLDRIWTLKNFEDFLKLIKNKKKVVLLSGGEPTVRDDLPQIIKLIKDSGNIPYLITNGVRLADYEYTKKLKDAGLEIVMFSLDSLIKETNDKLRGGHGIYDAKMQALENIRRCGIRVYLSMTVIDGLNDKEIGNMINFAAMNSDYISGVILRPVLPWGKITYDIGKDLVISDLIKLASIQTNGLINKEYLLEFRRFRFNSYRLIQKLFGKKYARDISFNFFLDCILDVRYDKGQKILEQMISYQELRKINKLMESLLNKSRTKMFISLYKLINKNLFWFIFTAITSKFNFSRLFLSSFYFKNKIRITFAEIGSQLDADASEKYGYYSIIFPKGVYVLPIIPYLMSIYGAGEQ